MRLTIKKKIKHRKTNKLRKTNKHRKTNKLRKTNKFRKNPLKNITLKGGELTGLNAEAKRNLEQNPINPTKHLQQMCKNPDNCLALGPYEPLIKHYFENFKNLDYVNATKLRTLGAVSDNGIVIEIPFTKNGYTAYTVLKTAAKAESDNLFYEYYVGKYFINRYIKRFPCFVETYDYYLFNNESAWSTVNAAIKQKQLNTLNIKDYITRKNIVETNFDNFTQSCTENKRGCVLIQHFDNFFTFEQMSKINYARLAQDKYQIWIQVYYCLATLGPIYTHFDLHYDNVCLYKPYDGNQYITMRYHFTKENKVLEFKSEYIVKIIDYGRNYFKTNITNTDEIIRHHIKDKPECDPDCGSDVGYNIIQGKVCNTKTLFHWILPNVPNMSHDLRFMYNAVKTHFAKGNIFNINYNGHYGTPENISPLDPNSSTINSVYDVKYNNIIHNLIAQSSAANYDATWTEAATMNIYDDGRDYEFVDSRTKITYSSKENTKITDKNINILIKAYFENKNDLPDDLKNISIGDWDVQNVTNFSELFSGRKSFNEPLENWNVSKGFIMANMFMNCTNFNQPLNKWNVSSVTDMTEMFMNCANFNQPLDKWVVSSVFCMNGIFQNCTNFNQSLNNWDVSKIEETSLTFYGCEKFNQPLNNWNVSKVTEMPNMFGNCQKFNQPLNNWNMSKVKNMNGMFSGCKEFNQPLNNWNVSKVTNMSSMFSGCNIFNQPLIDWIVTNVTDMSNMFEDCKEFNQPLNDWNVSNVTNTSKMFDNCQTFNQHLNDWNVIKVTNMSKMFDNCRMFNQSLDDWNVSNVTNMFLMFNFCENFNHELNNWNTSKVTNMSGMFSCSAFNQPLDKWNVSNVTDMSHMFDLCDNFNQNLSSWNVKNVKKFKYVFEGTAISRDNMPPRFRI